MRVENRAPVTIGVVDPVSGSEYALTASEAVKIRLWRVRGRFKRQANGRGGAMTKSAHTHDKHNTVHWRLVVGRVTDMDSKSVSKRHPVS